MKSCTVFLQLDSSQEVLDGVVRIQRRWSIFVYGNDETPVPLGKGLWKSSKSRWSIWKNLHIKHRENTQNETYVKRRNTC